MSHAVIHADALTYLRGNRWLVQNGESCYTSTNHIRNGRALLEAAPTVSQRSDIPMTTPILPASPVSDNLKRCTKCGELKPLSAFGKHKNCRDGIRSYCKACGARYTRGYAKTNPEWKRAANKLYNERHPDRRLARNRTYRNNNPDVYAASRAHRRDRARKMLSAFTTADWLAALEYFGGCCAACGRPPGLWHKLAADHWIPVTSPDCPGTVTWNIVPLCHGVGGCNSLKLNKNPREWVIGRFGARKGARIINRIEQYLDQHRPNGEDGHGV